MLHPTSETLPDEIWRIILELCHDVSRPKYLCALMLVCKSWKALAEPILFRTVSDRRHSRVLAVVVSRARTDHVFARWIRALQLMTPREADSARSGSVDSAIMSLLLRTTLLHEFKMTLRPVQVTHLEALRRSVTRLSKLCIFIDRDHSAAMGIISELSSLQQLEIYFAQTTDWDMQATPPLNMPQVSRLSWIWKWRVQNDDMPRMLASYSFARNGHFRLEIPHLSAHSATLLSGWLHTHSPSILMVHMPDEAMRALHRPLSRTSQAGFISFPPADLFKKCKWPRNIVVTPQAMDLNVLHSFFDDVIALLNKETTRGHVVPHLKSIVFPVANETQPFHWDPASYVGEDPFKLLRGPLTRCAIQLSRHQVRLLDCNSRDLKSYFG